MGLITKLVIYTSEEELAKHAGMYPNLVNYDPIQKTGQSDDGAGHYGSITFVAIDPATMTGLPPGEYDNVEFIKFPAFGQQGDPA